MSNRGLAKNKRTRGEGDIAIVPPRTKLQRMVGRPELYEEAWLPRACELARAGATDAEIAHDLGVSIPAFYATIGRHPEFRDAVKRGKDEFDDRIVSSLGRRAAGYSHKTEKVFANGARFEVIEHVPPDTTAQIFWLKNRKRLDWRDRHETEIVVPVADENPETLDQRQLALAALALLNDAAYSPPSPVTIEATRNPEEGIDDGTEDPDTAATQGAQDAARGDRERQGNAEPFDPDFDLDE